MDVSLVMFTQRGERRDFVIHGKQAIIGRTTQCDIQIELSVVSRRHCEVSVRDDLLLVRDLGSSNGTYVNEKRIQEAGLHAGDKLTIGPVVFTVVIDGDPSDIKPIPTVLEPRKEDREGRLQSTPAESDETGSIDSPYADLDLLAEEEKVRSGHPIDPVSALESLAKQKKP